MQQANDLAALFDRPAKLEAITGTPVDMTLPSGAASAVACLLRMRDKTMTRNQVEITMRLLFESVSLSNLIRLWISARVIRWTKS